MKKRRTRKPAHGIISFKVIFKRLALLSCVCLVFRISASFGADDAANSFLRNIAGLDSVVTKILGMELKTSDSPFDSSGLSKTIYDAANPENDSGLHDFSDSASNAESDDFTSGDGSLSASDNNLFFGIGDNLPEIHSHATVNTSPVSYSSAGIEIKNTTTYQVDIENLISSNITFSLPESDPAVLIIHTHGSEAYAPDGNDTYTETDPSRTEDKTYNVIRVGDELSECLSAYGINVLHDRELYDYPKYSGSYNRSLDAMNRYLEQYPSIKVVIDLHRDAIVDSGAEAYKTIAQIGDQTCSQVLMVMGTDYSGLYHPHWQENLKLALRFQSAMNTMYPSLAKPIRLSQYRYNQHITTGSLILEVGSNGNTLQESLTAVRLFADAAAVVLLNLDL